MLKKSACVVLFIAILFSGFSLRFFNASHRIPHADECEQASTFAKLLDTGVYSYNPNGPHGPTLYYYALACNAADNFFGKIFGGEFFSEGGAQKDGTSLLQKKSDKIEIERLRLYVLGISVFIFGAFLLLKSEIGVAGALAGFACFWLSATAGIYSVYFVQELIFALSVLLVAYAFWTLLSKPSLKNALLLGLAAALAQSTKETAPIAFLAIFLSALCCARFCKVVGGGFKTVFFSEKTFSISALTLLGFAALFCTFYSSFGENPQGILDAFSSYFHFADKAQNPEHTQGFFYYAKLLALQKSEGVRFGELPLTLAFLISMCACAIAIKRRCNQNIEKINGGQNGKNPAVFSAYLGGAALINALILSFIPYKNPWLMLTVVILICAAAGWGISKILFAKNNFAALAGILAISSLALWQNNLDTLALKRFNTDPRNPFLYSHTVSDFNNLISRIQNCARVSEYGREIPVAFITKNSPWPAPWFLRKYPNVGFWSDAIPDNIGLFEIIACDSPFEKDVEKSIKGDDYILEYFGLRKNLALRVWIKKKLFNESIK